MRLSVPVCHLSSAHSAHWRNCLVCHLPHPYRGGSGALRPLGAISERCETTPHLMTPKPPSSAAFDSVALTRDEQNPIGLPPPGTIYPGCGPSLDPPRVAQTSEP